MATPEKETAHVWIDEHRELIVAAHQQVWDLAEVGLQETATSKLLADILEDNGFTVERGVAGMPTAFVATYGSGSPVIGMMAELDALPGLNQEAVPYQQPRATAGGSGAGHGCGHCGYAATALGAALAAKAAMEAHSLPGTLKCFGCPAEETLVGKVFMVRDGIFDGLDACLGHHPGSTNVAFLGTGVAMNSVKFEFFGKASHAGGSPEQGISALDAVELMNVGVNFMREHVVQETRMHYVIEAGGHEPNVVPAYARSWYYIRAPERDLVDRYYAWVLRIADGADLMAGTTHKVRFLTGAHNGIPNRHLAERVVANMREIGAPTYTEEEEAFAAELARSTSREEKRAALRKSHLPEAMELMDVNLNSRIYDPYGEGQIGGGSTDVAEVSWVTPTVEFSTAAFVVAMPGHSWQHTAASGTSIAHKSTIFAAKVMASTALDLLTDPEVLTAVRADWETRLAGRTYTSPLPPDLKPPLDQLDSHAPAAE
jgi:aminobenzoyl-glutamate utilization protein B